MALHSTGRIDDLIVQFERLQSDAHDIFNARVEELRRDSPNAGFGALKTRLLAPAGPAVNYVEALKLLRRGLLRR